jgi:hypothetical protein
MLLFPIVSNLAFMLCFSGAETAGETRSARRSRRRFRHLLRRVERAEAEADRAFRAAPEIPIGSKFGFALLDG